MWDDYKVKKQRVKSLIHQKTTQLRFDRSVKIAKAGGPSSRDFWKELRGAPKKDSLSSLKLPGSDEVVSDKNVMRQSIMHYWNTLGKMDMELNGNDKHDNKVDELVKSIRRNNGTRDLDGNNLIMNDIVIVFNDVKEAITESKNNKSPGLDLITNELLNNGGDGLVNSLTKLFNRFLALEGTAYEWNKVIIVPIFKKGSKNDLNNNRGITLTSCVSKIFNRIIAKNISMYVEDNKILSEIQGGFRKNHRCEHHILSLKGIAAARLAENQHTYMAFLDFRKAFDTVWRNGLLLVAWKLGVRGKTWKS